MFTIIVCIALCLLLPLMILRRFSFMQKALVLAIIMGHVGTMCFLHYRLVKTTGFVLVMDTHNDVVKYYNWTKKYAGWRPFSISRREAIRAAEGDRHFGYQWVLGTLWTITEYPILGIRLLKTLLLLTSLSCLARVWRTDYGTKLATAGFAFMSIVCTPAFYYNYRNLKDGLVLSLFVFTMALLDELLRRREDQLRPISVCKTSLAWCLVIMLLYAISTLRLYAGAMVVMAIAMHMVVASKMGVRKRASLLGILIVITILTLRGGLILGIMEMGEERMRRASYGLYGLLQAFLSPIPWGSELETPLVVFQCIYLPLLPYALYVMAVHFRRNLDWHLFLYMMVLFISGVLTGNPGRKRIIIYPILVMWVLAHLAQKRQAIAEQEESEGNPHYQDYYDKR